MIIDCHCHAGLGDGLTGPWNTRAPLARYRVWAHRAGIQRTVLFSAFHSDYGRANLEVARIVARYPRRYLGFVFVHGERDRGRVYAHVAKMVKEHGFCGIKVHRHDARISREICDVAADLKLPILYDVGGEISGVELLAREYPKVSFIIPHLGSFSDDWASQQALIDPLTRFSNVYADTSGVRRFDVLQEAVRRAGAHKFLFGSDGPWLHPGLELHKIRLLRLGVDDENAILGGNLLRLLDARGRK
jgi:predicted TIM-barrel fold metal-dependent hydrolase